MEQIREEIPFSSPSSSSSDGFIHLNADGLSSKSLKFENKRLSEENARLIIENEELDWMKHRAAKLEAQVKAHNIRLKNHFAQKDGQEVNQEIGNLDECRIRELKGLLAKETRRRSEVEMEVLKLKKGQQNLFRSKVQFDKLSKCLEHQLVDKAEKQLIDFAEQIQKKSQSLLDLVTSFTAEKFPPTHSSGQLKQVKAKKHTLDYGQDGEYCKKIPKALCSSNPHTRDRLPDSDSYSDSD